MLNLHTRKSLTKMMCICYHTRVRAGLRASIHTNFVLEYIYTEKMAEIDYPIFLMLCTVVKTSDEKYDVLLKKS